MSEIRLSLHEIKQVVTWLGYEASQYVSLYDTPPIFDQPNLDVMVLRKVRQLGIIVLNDFRHQLENKMMQLPPTPGCFTHNPLYSLLYHYEPGLYVEAARFLWEKS